MVEKKKTSKSAAPAAKKPGGKAAPKAPAKAAAKAAPAAPAPEPVPGGPPAKKVAAAPSRPAATGVHDLGRRRGPRTTRSASAADPAAGTVRRRDAATGPGSRSGYRHERGFEGGQMPLHRRVPKRGFTNIFRIEYDIVNLGDLADRFEAGASVTPETLATARLSRKSRPVKILGDGELKKALNVSAHKFSASAKARIEAAGGRCEVLSR